MAPRTPGGRSRRGTWIPGPGPTLEPIPAAEEGFPRARPSRRLGRGRGPPRVPTAPPPRPVPGPGAARRRRSGDGAARLRHPAARAYPGGAATSPSSDTTSSLGRRNDGDVPLSARSGRPFAAADRRRPPGGPEPGAATWRARSPARFPQTWTRAGPWVRPSSEAPSTRSRPAPTGGAARPDAIEAAVDVREASSSPAPSPPSTPAPTVRWSGGLPGRSQRLRRARRGVPTHLGLASRRTSTRRAHAPCRPDVRRAPAGTGRGGFLESAGARRSAPGTGRKSGHHRGVADATRDAGRGRRASASAGGAWPAPGAPVGVPDHRDVRAGRGAWKLPSDAARVLTAIAYLG